MNHFIASNGYESYDQLGTKVKIGMMTLPKMRYIRKTVRSMLDFISKDEGVGVRKDSNVIHFQYPSVEFLDCFTEHR